MNGKMYSFEDIFANKQKILFVTAHPDDVDVFFGGVLCRLAEAKKEVKVLVVTSGARGSRDNEISEEELGRKRLKEEERALSILGLDKKNVGTFGYLDGEVENNLTLIGEISGLIREFAPQIVCTHDPEGYYGSLGKYGFSFINHRDHRNTGLSTMDAIYPFSRDRSFFKEQIEAGLSTHSVYEIFLARNSTFNAKLDITQVIDKKKEALLAHQSQFSKKDVEEIISDFKEGNKYFEKGNFLKLAW